MNPSPCVPRLLCVLALALACLGNPAEAQSYRTRTYTEIDGLRSTSIHSIAQAQDGRLCVGTRSGIVMYDGSTWETQRFPGLVINQRLDVVHSEEGALLAVEHRSPHRVFQHDGLAWIPFALPLPRGLPESGLAEIAATGSGVGLRFLLSLENGPLVVWNGTHWTKLLDGAQTPVLSLAVTAGRFVLLTEHEIYLLNPEAALPELLRVDTPADQRFYLMAKVPGSERIQVLGKDWFGELNQGVLKRDPNALAFVHQGIQVPEIAIADERGGLYLGSALLAYYYTPTEGTILRGRREGFDPGSMICGFRDREGLIWSGGFRGLTKTYARDWFSYDARHGFGEDEVTVVLELSDGAMLFGHPGSISILDTDMQTRRVTNSANQERILGAVEAEDGQILLAASEAGLLSYSRDSGQVTRLPFSDPADRNPCRFVARDSQGRLMAISRNRVLRQVDGVWTQVPAHPNIWKSNARQLLETRSGALLVTTGKQGVLEAGVPEPRQWSSLDNPQGNDVVCVSQRADGRVWAGTMDGLYQLEGSDRLVPLDLPGLQVKRPVFFITDDSQGSTWFGLDNGVIRWDGSSAHHITARDGLVGAETNRAAGFCDKQGRMWIGTDRGATVHDPRESLAVQSPPTLELVALTAEGAEEELACSPAMEHELTQDRNALVYFLRTISFVDEDRVRHQTWLEGYEDSWSEFGVLASPHLIYSHLPPGRYRLHARAMNINGTSSQRVSSPWITIIPPLWGRTWFLVGASLAVLALMISTIGFAAKHRFTRQLEATVSARTQDLALEKNRLEATLAHICDGVVMLATDGKIVLWNKAAEEITGWSADESIGMGIQERFGVPDVGPRRSNGLATITNKHGKSRVLETSTAPISGHPESLSRVIAFRDITERQKNTARARHLDSLGKLAGGIAHDFNNLLTVVIGNLALFERMTGPDAKGRHRIESINAAVNQARSLTQQLITFSEGGEPLRTPGAIEPLLRETAKLVPVSPSIVCHLEFEPDLYTVEMDAGQMIQVFQNLVLNATQAMNGKGHIILRARNNDVPSASGQKPQVLIEIEDDGPGIGKGVLHRVFEPYFSTKADGTGLGLAMAHSIVTRHGGSLRVESEVGRGTLFRVFLPGIEPKALPLLPPAKTAPHKSESLTVLVMDDEEAVREVMQSLLESLGHRCVVTADGLAAVEQFRGALAAKAPFDLVILDLTVPGGIGGKRAIGELLMLDPDVRAIAMSGYANEPILARHTEYGFRGRLSKPYRMDELNQVIRDAMAPIRPVQIISEIDFAP